MILFLGTEVATFGAGFVYYFFIRVGGKWAGANVPEGSSARSSSATRSSW